MKTRLRTCSSDTNFQKFYKLLGIKVNALTLKNLNTLVEQAIKFKKHQIIGNHNLHSVYLFHQDPKMRSFYDQADYIQIDGMPIVLLGRLFGLPLQRQHRVTYADWTPHIIAQAAQNGWRIFYLGGKPGVAEIGANRLRQQYPTLEVATAHGYFNTQPTSAENQSILAAIQAYKPHILMVGMSMPRQEHWILDNLEQITANVILPSGAAIDYVAGVVPTPPRWAGTLGLEWLFRLVAEPKRLWQRYLIEPWFLLKWFVKNGLKP
jgi:N-acetylglucosaminyldiphosphoundecaprenol N-acetyl-beta-D-mannosaminyltransferase